MKERRKEMNGIKNKDKDEDKYVDIFNKISHGLKSDFTDPKTKQIWRVKDYLDGKTEGIRVYTPQGKFLGTSYYSIKEAIDRKERRKIPPQMWE